MMGYCDCDECVVRKFFSYCGLGYEQNIWAQALRGIICSRELRLEWVHWGDFNTRVSGPGSSQHTCVMSRPGLSTIYQIFAANPQFPMARPSSASVACAGCWIRYHNNARDAMMQLRKLQNTPYYHLAATGKSGWGQCKIVKYILISHPVKHREIISHITKHLHVVQVNSDNLLECTALFVKVILWGIKFMEAWKKELRRNKLLSYQARACENNLFWMRRAIIIMYCCDYVWRESTMEPEYVMPHAFKYLYVRQRGNYSIQNTRAIKLIWSVTCSIDINLRD